MAYPSTIPTYSTKVDGSSYPQAADVNNLQADVIALATKVGITGSAVSGTVDYILNNNIWPVGAVFLSVLATNPNTLLGIGTWSQIAQGQMLVGFKTGDSDFGTVQATGGSKTSTSLIAHTHTGPSHTHTGTTDNGGVDHTHNMAKRSDCTVTGSNQRAIAWDGGGGGSSISSGSSAYIHTHTITTATSGTGATGSAGSGSSFSILNPFYVIYVWKRTA